MTCDFEIPLDKSTVKSEQIAGYFLFKLPKLDYLYTNNFDTLSGTSTSTFVDTISSMAITAFHPFGLT